MDANYEAFRDLWNSIYSSDETEEIRTTLQHIDDQEHAGNLSVEHAASLRVGAVRALKDLTSDEPNVALPLMITDVLPLCLVESNDDHVRYAARQNQSILAEWVAQYPGSTRTSLRDAVLDHILATLASGRAISAACATLAAIGYRRADIPSALWTVIASDSEHAGNVALASLALLGVTDSERVRVIEEARRRVSSHSVEPLDLSLIMVFDHLAAPELLSLVKERLDHNQPLTMPDTYLAQVCAGIAGARDEDEGLQDEAWAIALAIDARARHPGLALEMNSSIVSHCDSSSVVPYLLRLWTGAAIDATPVGQYRVGLRLSECIRPRHLESSTIEAAGDTRIILRQAALLDTGTEGRDTTIEMNLKEIAWDSLLRIGEPDAPWFFDLALSDESNSFARRRVCRLLACFRIHPLPASVRRWVTEPFDDDRSGDSLEWAYRVAAIDAAHSSDSRQALDDLLVCGYTVRGEALRQSADAVADLARSFARKRDRTIISTFTSRLARIGARPAETVLAAVGLHAVAQVAPKLVDNWAIEILMKALQDNSHHRYEKSIMLMTVMLVRPEAIDTNVVELLVQWVEEQDDWLAVHALETLATLNQLLQHSDLVRDRLGLEYDGRTWRRTDAPRMSEWAPTIVGMLYRRDPGAFIDVLSDIIRNGQWDAAIQAIHQIRATHGKPNGPEMPRDIVDALVFRARVRQRSRAGETAVFAHLAALAPERLVSELWEDVLADWLPDVRVALAESIEGLRLTDTASTARSRAILLSLIQDGSFAVRRAAYRAFAHQSSDTFILTCSAWQQSSVPELRQRAAEASTWYTEDTRGAAAFQLAQVALTTDQELAVRDAATRAAVDRQNRRWALMYLARVLDVKKGTSTEMLDVWKYGQALTSLGDDGCLRALQDHVGTHILPPHVRFWISTIYDALRDQWKKVTQGWPDPWIAFDGALYEGAGSLQWADGTSHKVAYSIWTQPSAVPQEPEKWGGSLTSVPMPHGEKASLRMEDGVERRIILVSAEDGSALFVGAQRFL